ncbi:MAG: hypothetical protein KUG74_14460 [Rhodobacteraceae bacterium]|nr:hypothetical protein [Paracoccaceae bacterium]
MRNFFKLHGVSLSAANNLPQIALTDTDKAIGSIPGWLGFWDPANINAEKIPNGVTNALHSAAASIPTGTLNGHPVLNLTDANSTSVLPDVAIPQTEFSFFGVVAPIIDTSEMNIAVWDAADLGTAGARGFRFGIQDDLNECYVAFDGTQSANPVERRVIRYTPATSFVGRTVLLMATFSIDEGWRIFENGVEVVSEPTEKDPLNAAYLAGEWRLYSYGRGKFGEAGLLDIDLGKAANAGYRRAIENLFMTKYAI